MLHRASLVSRAPWLGAALALALIVGIAFADEESDRKDLISKIEGRLDYAAGELSGLESDSDAGDVNDALGYVREVESYLNDLSRVKGSDSTANNIVSYYPGYIRDFRSAAEELRKLKDKQRLAELTFNTCKAFNQEMTQRAQNAKDEPRAADELREFAKSVGRKGEDLMSEAYRKLSEVERHRDDTKRFSASDGKWSNVRSYMHYSADAIARIHKDDYDKAKRECDEVVKRERHGEVEKALGRLANSKAGRAELMTKVTAMLGVISERVNDVDNQSSESNVSGAIEVTREVLSLLDRLKSAQGDDDEAKRIASEWPSWTGELRAALEGLRAMKLKQRMADEGAGKCAVAERELQALIKDILATPTRHAGGTAEIERLANKLRDDWKPRLEAAAQGDRELNDGYRAARAFGRSDGPWSPIRDRLHSSADDILRHWTDKYGAAKRACEPLTLGLSNPDAAAAVTQLGRDISSTSERSKAFYAELKLWEAEITKLRDWSRQDVEEIRQAFCRAPDAGDYEEATAVADRWASQLKSQYGVISGRAEQLKQAADALIAKGRSRDRMEKVKAKIDAAMASIDKIRAYQLEGSNNPLFKAQTSYGVAEHERRQRSCDAKEITIRGDCDNPHPKRQDCRIDCMKRCEVVEIKPKSQESLGERQAKAYFDALRAKFAKSKMDMFKDFPYFAQCVNADKTDLNITWRVEPYDFCEGISPDRLGALVPQVDVASEAAE